jgi:hypothetical protein
MGLVTDDTPQQISREVLLHQYEQLCLNYRAIDDFRGKLLALWPILGGAAGGVSLLLSNSNGTSGLWAIGLFGLSVSIGIAVYEWHQTLRCDQLKKSARKLEQLMGFEIGTGQFQSLPRGFRPRTTGPPLDELKGLIEREDQERETTSPDGESVAGHHVIRVGVASAIVYGSVIMGWFGLFLWAIRDQLS